MSNCNQKYEITDIVHEKYPVLHRIRALRDIGPTVKAGDLGGFVEHESSLAFEPGDDSWVYDDAIVAGEGRIDHNSSLRDQAVVCGHAYVSESLLTDHARVEDNARVQRALVLGNAKVAGQGEVLPPSDNPLGAAALYGHCCIYGKVVGNVHIRGKAVIADGEEIRTIGLETILIDGESRTVLRNLERGKPTEKENKSKRKEVSR